MTITIYYVMRGEEGWIVRLGDRDFGHSTLTAALRAAIAAARSSAAGGLEAQVLVQRPDGAWVVLWTSEDNCPPEAGEQRTESLTGPRSFS